ncbi:MAG: hypothetical protein KDM81_09115, partial [Verrucomicrobiae bacterium]|nr:hypothetical protein [Verrucomicrobiae bacterium]
MRTPLVFLGVIAVVSATGLLAQNLLPNPAFEEPATGRESGGVDTIKNRPLGWALTGCAGGWR